MIFRGDFAAMAMVEKGFIYPKKVFGKEGI